MTDQTTTVATLRQAMASFVAERKWQRYHNAKNVSMSIAIEASELMEIFQWVDTDELEELSSDPVKMQAVEDEIADVFLYVLSFANATGIDLSAAVERKMVKNRTKYPTERFQGNYEKVDG